MMPAELTGPQDRVMGNLAFVESVARRVAASMPHTIDLGDLVQDGMVGLIDAAHRFDEGRGIKFETFAERRVRGAMIDALRKDAWPRGVRRQRRELEAAREALRRETGAEPSLADLAARVGTDEQRLGRTIVRITTIESTSVLSAPDGPIESALPDVCVPPETPTPDRVYEIVRDAGARPPGDCVAARARAQGDRALLLPRRHDEADWRGDRRERIARLAAARARDSAVCRSRSTSPALTPSRDWRAARFRGRESADGEGAAAERAGRRRDRAAWSCPIR